MSNICHNVKQEYETLQALKRAFVSACDAVGNIDALSKQELNKLKRLKKDLEQKRNALEMVIENKETRIWKKIYERVMSAVVEEDGKNKGKSVKELIAEPDFKEGIYEKIVNSILGVRTHDSYARYAVELFHAARELNLLTEEHRENIQVWMEKQEFQRALRDRIRVQAGDERNDAGYVVTGFYAACELDLFVEDGRTEIQDLIGKDAFQNAVARIIMDDFSIGEVDGVPAHRAAKEFAAALGLGMLKSEERERIQECVEKDEFQKRIVHVILLSARDGQINSDSAFYAAEGIAAIKKIVELSQRRRST